MEFSSIWYFSFWSLVSLVFSTTGILALRKATIPVSDFVKIQFGYFFATSMTGSTLYAFLLRPALEHDQDLNIAHRYKILLIFYMDFIIINLPVIYFLLVSSAYDIFLEHKWLAVVLFLVLVVWTPPNVVNSFKMRFKDSQAIGNLPTAFAGPLIMYPYHTLCWVLCQGFLMLHVKYAILGFWDSDLQSIFSRVFAPSSPTISAFHFWKLVNQSIMAAHVYEHQKIIEIVIGILGTTLAQYYFRVKSMSLMLGLISYAFAWLGFLANVQPRADFGIFHFLVSASLECAVSLFGLHFYTFLVVCGGIVLMILRWKMEFVSLRHFGLREEVMRDWKLLEELDGNGSNNSSIQTHDPEQPSEGGSNAQRLGIQRRLAQQLERLWAPYAGFRT